MAARGIRGSLIGFVVCLLSSLPVGADRSAADLSAREEWKLARQVWSAMGEHAAGRIFNRHEFALLKPDLDQAKEGLDKLAKEKLLEAAAAADLGDFLEARYDYLADNLYPASANIVLSGVDLVRAGAFARFEIHLAAFREPGAEGRERARVVARAREGMVQQMEMLRQAQAAQEQLAKEEEELREKEGKGEKVDWTRARLRWARRTFDLVRSFQAGRRLRISRETGRLSELVFALSAKETAPGPG
jgi:hypothetical protein